MASMGSTPTHGLADAHATTIDSPNMPAATGSSTTHSTAPIP